MNLLLTSCVDEPEVPTVELDETTQVAKVKAWFEENKTKLRLPERGSNFRTESQELILPFFEKEPDWDKFHHYYFPDGREVFEINLENATKYFPTSMLDSFPDRNPAEVVIQNILFVKHPTQERFDPVIARYYPANSSSEKSFEDMNYRSIDYDWSGIIEMFTYDEHHFVGFEIKEGEVVRDFTRKRYGGEKQKSTANLDVSCTTHYYPVGYETCAGSSCHTTINYYIAETSCSGGDLGTTKSYEYPTGESSSDGTTTTDGNGTCSTCEYEPPSLSVPSFKIKNSISPDEYPCLRSGVNEAINKNFSNEIQKLILEVFEESENFNIEIEAYDFQDNTIDGTCVPTYIERDGTYAKFLITINTHLENTSQEYITATVFHEFTHAYLDYLDLPNYSPNDSISHEEMASKYLERLSSILVDQYGISRSHAEALSWGGLGETNLYKNLSEYKKNSIGQINYGYKYGELGTKCN